MFHTIEHENHRIQQFQDSIQDQKYFDLVEKLVRKSFEKAKDVQIYDGKSAYEPWPVSNGYVHYLKINRVFDTKRSILYELMHEMGHLFDPISLDRNIDKNSEHPASERSREIRAWAFADEEFKKHSELNDYAQEYLDHKRKALSSYEIVI
jgi:hypothetical protein